MSKKINENNIDIALISETWFKPNIILYIYCRLFNHQKRPTRRYGWSGNTHHKLWGSYNRNSYGIAVVEALNSSELVLINDGSPTKLSKNGKTSAVVFVDNSDMIYPKRKWNTIKTN